MMMVTIKGGISSEQKGTVMEMVLELQEENGEMIEDPAECHHQVEVARELVGVEEANEEKWEGLPIGRIHHAEKDTMIEACHLLRRE